MYIESLLLEVQKLSNRFSPQEALLRADAGEEPAGWNSARGLLDIVMACDRISEISAKISKAGYWECEKDLLAEIGAQSRRILYHINDMKLSDGVA